MAKTLTNDQLLMREYVKQQFSTSHFSKESDYFEFLAASQALREYDLSDEEIESGLIGNGGDGGCDAAYLFYNEALATDDFIANLKEIPKEASLHIVIVQAKNELSFHENAIMKWKTVSENLLQFDNQISSYRERYTEAVLDFFQSFRDLRIKLLTCKVKIVFKYLYVSLANELHPNVKAQALELKELLHGLFPGSTTCVNTDFIGASDLMELINTQASQRFTLPLEEIPITIGTYKNYVALVKIRNYYHFITDDHGALRKYIFESNVRDYQGHNTVNNEIRNTLSEDTSEDF